LEKIGIIFVLGVAVAALVYAVSPVFQSVKVDKGTKKIQDVATSYYLEGEINLP
jgi:hypothetical protein